MAVNPNAQDLGGPGGRKGPLGDAASLTTPDVTAGRVLFTGGSRPGSAQPFRRALPDRAIAQSQITALQLIVTAVYADTLACRTIDDNQDVGGELIIIAKPPHLRKSIYEVSTSFLEITQVTSSTREYKVIEPNSGQETVREESITPAYTLSSLNSAGQLETLGSIIYAALAQSVSQYGASNLIDLNIEGRQWVYNQTAYKYYQITEVNKDTYWGQEWDYTRDAQAIDSTGALKDPVLIAKPHEIRGSTWAGETIGGVAYTVTGDATEAGDHDTREGVGAATEDQEITPPWFVDTTIIRAAFVEGGTGAFRSGTQAMWQDTNDGARAFAEVFS